MRRAMRQDVPPMLQRAHELMATGNYPAAAEAFEQLARAGEARQHPRTGQMYLQAGRARILAGQKEAGFAHLKRGLSLMVAYPIQLQRAGERIVSELNQRGMSAEAQEIAQWLKTSAPAMPVMASSPQTKRPVLPTTCPACGGVVHAQDVEWLDENTAECEWCGSPIRAEG
jgi:hypothetical protein